MISLTVPRSTTPPNPILATTPRATFAKPQLGPTETRILALSTPSPLSIRLAADAPDYNRLPELIEIIQFGALLRVDDPPPGSSMPTRRHVSNHNSTTLYAVEVRALLKAEIEAGTTFNIGPTLPREWRTGNAGTWVCPLGAVPKSSSTPSKPCVRMIFDASHGGRLSLNDRITTSTAPLGASPYLSAQAIASTLLAAGKDALYSLTDVKSAFNNISLHPSQFRFSVISFDGDYHIQTRLGFGYTSAPDLFETVIGAFDHIQKLKKRLILRIVDDILNVDGPSSAKTNTDSLRADMDLYGIPRASNKDVNQQTSVKFDGLLWDAPSLTVAVPPARLASIQESITAASLAHPSLHLIEQVTGKLMSIVCVFPEGKSHLQFLYRAITVSTIKFGHKSSPNAIISAGARKELHWWKLRLTNPSPRPMSALAADNLPLADSLDIYTDASGTGLGVYIPLWGYWTFMSIPAKFQIAPHKHTDDPSSSGSTLIEVAAILLAVTTFQSLCACSNIHVHCDNSGAVAIFQRHHSSSPRIGAMLTAAVDIATSRNINIRTSWIPGSTNTIADPISRSNWPAFRALAPHAHHLPSPAPSSPFDVIS